MTPDTTDADFAEIVAGLRSTQEGDEMRYSLPDGKVVVGRSYYDIVRAMADEKFVRPRSLVRYRKSLAERVAAMYGQKVNTSSDKVFVNSLVEAGLLVKIK
jgi:hypothetical protein